MIGISNGVILKDMVTGRNIFCRNEVSIIPHVTELWKSSC